MHLSIVTGTYNRLAALKRMMQSVREQLPMHIAYEFVIADGGSTDGTLEWLKVQPNTHVIHDRLEGAIIAFTRAAREAQGEYVVLANDDITFHPYSLLTAIRYLEMHPDSGAVAFADNRSAQVHNHITGHRTEGMGAISVDGLPVNVTYAQVGMFRRWLGDQVGWWGADDAVMSQSRTYGGDNYLSARIWELGYSVDPVHGCAIDDHIANDSLRAINGARGHQDSAAYYERFPNGPQLRTRPAIRQATAERLRILYLPVHEGRGSEYGMGEALASVGLTIEFDYLHANNLSVEFVHLVKAWQPDLMITQIQGAGELDARLMEQVRKHCPDMVVVNWNGDAHMLGLTDPKVLDILRKVDLQTCINAQAFDTYNAECIPHAYWQIGYKDPVEFIEMPSYEVLFLGNCYNEPRNNLNNTLRMIRRRSRLNVGIYGNCPDANGVTNNDFARSTTLIKNASIVIGDTFDPDNTIGFVSNRVFQTLAAGGFLLQQHSNQLAEYTGLEPGIHYAEWHDLKDLSELILFYLARPDERSRMAKAGQAYVREHFSYDAQVKKLFMDLLPEIA